VKKKRKGCIYTRERENLVFKRWRKCVWEIEVKYERVRENVCKRYSLCERECVCVCVCGGKRVALKRGSCVREREIERGSVCERVLCVWEREKERERERENFWFKRERKCVCVCVCVREFVCVRESVECVYERERVFRERERERERWVCARESSVCMRVYKRE